MAELHDRYRHSKITESGIIRLILLEPSEDLKADLKCSLIDVWLKDYDNDLIEYYIALSYVWGDASKKGSINVDGKILEITASLEVALQHVRDRSRILCIWADGICINQDDVEDRNTQVSVMGSIYAIARHTIIFLGPSNPGRDAVLETITRVNNFEELDTDDSLDTPDISIFVDIMKNPWFTRVWVMQELVLSADPWVQSGRMRVRWDPFWRYMVTKTRQARSHHLNIIRSMGHVRNKWRAGKSDLAQSDRTGGLLEILEVRRGLGVRDLRDMVYAHLGLSTPLIRSNLIIDYSKSIRQVYEDVARSIYKATGNLTFLTYKENFDDLEAHLNLPSWVPDWSLPSSSEFDKERRSSTQTRYKLHLTSYRPQGTPGVLHVKCVLYGTVIHILPQALVSKENTVRFRVGRIEQPWVNLIYQPDMWSLVKLLLTYMAYNYEEFREFILYYKDSPRYLFDPEAGSMVERTSELVTSLPLETQKALKAASASPKVLFRYIYCALDLGIYCQQLRSEALQETAFIQYEKYISVLNVPKQTRVGDILVGDLHHLDFFTFRPDGKYPKVRNDLTSYAPLYYKPSSADTIPSKPIACKYVSYGGEWSGRTKIYAEGIYDYSVLKDPVTFTLAIR